MFEPRAARGEGRLELAETKADAGEIGETLRREVDLTGPSGELGRFPQLDHRFAETLAVFQGAPDPTPDLGLDDRLVCPLEIGQNQPSEGDELGRMLLWGKIAKLSETVLEGLGDRRGGWSMVGRLGFGAEEAPEHRQNHEQRGRYTQPNDRSVNLSVVRLFMHQGHRTGPIHASFECSANGISYGRASAGELPAGAGHPLVRRVCAERVGVD